MLHTTRSVCYVLKVHYLAHSRRFINVRIDGYHFLSTRLCVGERKGFPFNPVLVGITITPILQKKKQRSKELENWPQITTRKYRGEVSNPSLLRPKSMSFALAPATLKIPSRSSGPRVCSMLSEEDPCAHFFTCGLQTDGRNVQVSFF